MQDKLLLVNLLISFAYQLHVAFFIYLNIFYVFIKFLCIFFSFKCNPCDTVFSRCFKMLLTLSNVADVNTQIGKLLIWFEIVISNLGLHNIVSMMIWRFLTSQCHISETATLHNIEKLPGHVLLLKKPEETELVKKVYEIKTWKVASISKILGWFWTWFNCFSKANTADI